MALRMMGFVLFRIGEPRICGKFCTNAGIDAAAVLSEDGSLNIFVLNRSVDSAIELSCDLRSFGNIYFKEQIVLHHENVKAINAEDEPNEVIPVVHHDYESKNGKFSILLPALSWNVLRFPLPP